MRWLVLVLVACGSRSTLGDEPTPGAGTTIESGTITGRITVREGDCMPPATPKSCRHVPGASRVVFLYPIQTSNGSPFPTKVDAPPIATGRSDSNGNYSLRAPAGHFSFFVEDSDHLYARVLVGNEIDPVDITLDGVTAYDFEINHATD